MLSTSFFVSFLQKAILFVCLISGYRSGEHVIVITVLNPIDKVWFNRARW